LFLGEHRHTLDDKSRVTIPAKYRKALEDGLVVTKGFENCLFVFSKTGWLEFSEQIRQLRTLRKDARTLSRFLFGGACEDDLDKSGRVVVPQSLRQWASIKKEIIVIGVSSRLEIWSKEKWEKVEKEAASSYSEIAEELADLGF